MDYNSTIEFFRTGTAGRSGVPETAIPCFGNPLVAVRGGHRAWSGQLRPLWRNSVVGLAPRHRPFDLGRALVNPASVFGSPQDVAEHPWLGHETKREILKRWAWDARLLEIATDEAMPEGEPSRLDEIVAALISLDDSPSAPPASAAYAVALPAASEDSALAA